MPQNNLREDPTIRVRKEVLSDKSTALIIEIEQDGQKIVLEPLKGRQARAVDRIADAIEEETLHVVTREY